MTQAQVLRKLQRRHWRSLQQLVKESYQEGVRAGLARAHGQGRRGRTIRADATLEGLRELIERHFGLDRYGFEIRIVHQGSGKRVPARDHIARYKIDG